MLRSASLRKALALVTVSWTGKAASAPATRPSSSATVTTSRLALFPGVSKARPRSRAARSRPPVKRSYIAAALLYKRRATWSASASRAGRTAGSDKSHACKRRSQAVVERRGLPAQLALRPAGVRRGVPEEEVELSAGEHRRLAHDARQQLAARCHRAGHGWRQGRGHPPAARHPHDLLGQLPDADVAVAEDVALARLPSLGREQLPTPDSLGEHDAAAPWRQSRSLEAAAVDQRLEELALEGGAAAGAGAVNRGGVDDHELHSGLRGRRQGQLLAPLLGALIGGALWVVRQLRLVESRAGRGVEDVDRAGVDDPPRACLGRRAHHGLAPACVDSLERFLVREPLLRQAHRVEHQLAALRGAANRRRIGDVAQGGLGPGGQYRGFPAGAQERTYLITSLEQRGRHRVAHLAGGSRDEGPHRAGMLRTAGWDNRGDGTDARQGSYGRPEAAAVATRGAACGPGGLHRCGRPARNPLAPGVLDHRQRLPARDRVSRHRLDRLRPDRTGAHIHGTGGLVDRPPARYPLLPAQP